MQIGTHAKMQLNKVEYNHPANYQDLEQIVDSIAIRIIL